MRRIVGILRKGLFSSAVGWTRNQRTFPLRSLPKKISLRLPLSLTRNSYLAAKYFLLKILSKKRRSLSKRPLAFFAVSWGLSLRRLLEAARFLFLETSLPSGTPTTPDPGRGFGSANPDNPGHRPGFRIPPAESFIGKLMNGSLWVFGFWGVLGAWVQVQHQLFYPRPAPLSDVSHPPPICSRLSVSLQTNNQPLFLFFFPFFPFFFPFFS